MSKYAIGLLALLVGGCSDRRAETTAHPASDPNPRTRPTVADTVPGTGGIVPRLVVLAQLPAGLRQPGGQLLEAWRWPDANGENLLVVFRGVAGAPAAGRRPAVPSPAPFAFNEAAEAAPDSARTAWLSVRQYVRAGPGGTYTELWRVRDFVANCPLALTLGPRPASTAITDLDHDGHSETTLVYALACRSGTADAGLKLVMREGRAKYALRGTTVKPPGVAPANPCCVGRLPAARRRVGNTDGYYLSEVGFRGAPPAFLRFARQHWQKFSVEKATAPPQNL